LSADSEHVDPNAGSNDEIMESALFDVAGQQIRRPLPVKPMIKPPPPPVFVGITEFGEEAYCEAYPDIHAAIEGGILESAMVHFRRHGRKENRLSSQPYLNALIGGGHESKASGVALSLDAAIISQNGTVLIVGWVDDRANRLRSVSIIQGSEGSNTRAIGRCRRADVDALLNAAPGYSFGFWLVLKLEPAEAKAGPTLVRARLADGSFEQRDVPASVSSDVELHETILGHFAALEYYGNRDIEAFANLEAGVGRALVALNKSISGAITSAAHAEYYGPRRSRFKASLIICLFGKLEYFFLQNALFAKTIGIEEYEFIYVSNSPELAESLHKEAQVAERIYGLSITLVTLPGNGGFSAANNAAARFANSDRVIFVNPDVFPRDRLWAQKHEALIETLPREHTAIFGVPLYYDDGSLMHGGMHFEVDQGLSVKANGITAHRMLRVEHYGKGAPVWSDKYTKSRPVPAVTGAFISADREWFQSLGGFTEDYIFGHYEDADLCLKSLRQGVPVWLHDIRFWHLEGKGSTRRLPHEGGSLVNRWLFTRRWGSTIASGLAGAAPAHPLLQAGQPSMIDETRLDAAVDAEPPPAFMAQPVGGEAIQELEPAMPAAAATRARRGRAVIGGRHG
jgi:GT2 family glycosyltransferase